MIGNIIESHPDSVEIKSNHKSIFLNSKVFYAIGSISLIIAIFQLSNSNVTYGILSLFYTGIFWTGGIHNKILRDLKLSGYNKVFDKIILTSLILGILLGTTCTYLILKIFFR